MLRETTALGVTSIAPFPPALEPQAQICFGFPHGETLLSKFVQSTYFTSVSMVTNSCVLPGFILGPRFLYLSMLPFTAVIWHHGVDFQLCPDFMQIYFQLVPAS